jgi:hypothetical protein
MAEKSKQKCRFERAIKIIVFEEYHNFQLAVKAHTKNTQKEMKTGKEENLKRER